MIGELLIGAACTVGGVTVGHIQGYLMGVKVRNITNLLTFTPEPEPVVEPETIQSKTHCQCTHGLQTHRHSGHGVCVVAIKDSTCACQFFVGKTIPNPRYVKKDKDVLDLS